MTSIRDVRGGFARFRRRCGAVTDTVRDRPPRWILIALWAAACIGIAISLAFQWANAVYPGESWESQGQLVDFRDTVWVTGRYLLAGGNPYDTATFLAAVPWTQGLALYPPAWLLFGVTLGPLPYLPANAVYQLIGVGVGLVLIRVVLRWTLPRYVAVGTPIALIWLVVWAAGRYALANVSAGLVALGVVLVLRGVWLRRSGSGSAGAQLATGATAVGVAMSLIKPQWGLPMLVVALVGRRWDAVWRGVGGLIVVSAPFLAACVVASGGIGGFVDGIRANLARSVSADAPTGLMSELNVRLDLIGQLARLGVDPPGWLQLAVPLLATVLAAWIAARSRSLIVLTAGVSSALLLGFVHEFYDLLVLVLPLCVGLGWLAERRRVSRTARATWLFASLPTVHVHRVTAAMVPGLTVNGANLIDTVLLFGALVLSVVTQVRGRDQEVGSPDAAVAVGPGSGQRTAEPTPSLLPEDPTARH